MKHLIGNHKLSKEVDFLINFYQRSATIKLPNYIDNVVMVRPHCIEDYQASTAVVFNYVVVVNPSAVNEQLLSISYHDSNCTAINQNQVCDVSGVTHTNTQKMMVEITYTSKQMDREVKLDSLGIN